MNKPAGESSLSTVRAARATSALSALREDPGCAPQGGDPTSPAQQRPPQAGVKSSWHTFGDFRRIPAALRRQARWLFGVAGGVALATAAVGFLQSTLHVSVLLIPSDASPAAATSPDNAAYRPRPLDAATLVNLLRSPELYRRTAASTQSPPPEILLTDRVTVTQEPGTELVRLTVTGRNRASLVALANSLASQAVALGRELQMTEAAHLTRFWQDKLAALDNQLQEVNRGLISLQTSEKFADPEVEKQAYVRQIGEVMARADNARIEETLLDLQIAALRNELIQLSPIAQKLEAARRKLTDLMGPYKEPHPAVQAQRALITELEKQLAAAGENTLSAVKYTDNPQAGSLYARVVDLETRKATARKELSELTKLHEGLLAKITGLSEKGLRYTALKAQFDGLQKSRGQLAGRLREAQSFQEDPPGAYRVFALATPGDADARSRWLAALVAGGLGLVLGGLGAGLVIAGRELADRRLKTALDVRRATGLPVLATLGDLSQMSTADREAWAFRTWTAIAGQLNGGPNHGIVCGLISSGPGEGRSTWIELLVGAARKRGLQVMTMATRPGKDPATGPDLPANVVQPDFGPGDGAATTRDASPCSGSTALATSRNRLLTTTPALTAHIPLPGKVWHLAHRKAWQNTLAQMSRMDSLVLLIELPPASVPEAVLLAESLPAVIWLADSGKSEGPATRQQLQTLRHAGCRLVGAVLNHEPPPVFPL